MQGQGRLVFGCALMRARAGTARLPYLRHLVEVTFRAWRLSSVQRLTCCNATSELFGSEMTKWLLRLLFICVFFIFQIMIIMRSFAFLFETLQSLFVLASSPHINCSLVMVAVLFDTQQQMPTHFALKLL